MSAGPLLGSAAVRALVRPHRSGIAVLAAISFIGALLEASFLVAISALATALVEGRSTIGPIAGQTVDTTTAIWLCALAIILRLGFSFTGILLSGRLNLLVTQTERERLATAFLRAPWEVQSAEPSGQLQSLLTTFVQSATNVIGYAGSGIVAALSMIAFLGAGLLVDARSTGMVIVALILLSLVLEPLRRHIRRKAATQAGAGLAFANSVAELGRLGQEVNAFGVSDPVRDRVHGLSAAYSESQRRVQVLGSALPVIYTTSAYVTVLAGIAVLSRVDDVDLAAVGGVLLLMLRNLSYGQQLVSALANLSAQTPFIDRMNDTVHSYEKDAGPPGAALPASALPMDAMDVSYTYPSGRLGITAATWHLATGEVVGIIGPSGAGKSTIAQLILGLRRPQRGELLVSEVPLHEVDRHWWSTRVAFLPQESILFGGTIAENIRFFRSGLQPSDITRAAEQANLATDMAAFPDGLDTHIGEGGRQLSGGQRQRVALARALAGGPELLVLDEPTSALDIESEDAIASTLAGLRGQMTVVIVAHRMSTLDACDRIMVVERGTITAFDKPGTVSEHSAFYRRALAIGGMGEEDAD